MAIRLQEWIHKFEEGTGSLLVRAGLGLMVMLFAAVFYNLTQFKNLNNPEGMDQAQLARNIARGRGFETHFIRPLSLHLVFRQATNALVHLEARQNPSSESPNASLPEEDYWLSLLQDRHPDLANAPLYPLLLAGVLKVYPFGFPNLVGDSEAEVFGPDRWIALFNQLLFLLAVWMTFRLARTWFDTPVAWLAGTVMIASELLWKFTASGQSVMFQMILFLWLMQAMGSLERQSHSDEIAGKSLMKAALFAGLLLGLMALTRYSFLLLLVPVSIMVGTLPTAKKGRLLAASLVVALLLVIPWLARNYHLSGTVFGTAGFELFQATGSFPEDTLQRSVNPDFREFTTSEFTVKLFKNLPRFLEWELPRFGGSWITAFFLVGLLVPFKNPALSRLRVFLVLALITGVLVRAMGAAPEAAEGGPTSVDPVLVTFAPLVFIFGSGLFTTLLNQISTRIPGIRLPVLGGFCLLFWFPLLLSYLVPVRTALAYPPYYPPSIQEKAGFVQENAWVMSDIPWAMAWYGDRSSVLWPSDYRTPGEGRFHNDFFEIHERFKSIQALYLSTQAMGRIETAPLLDWISRSDEEAWESSVADWEAFMLVGILLKNEVPQGFPLKNAPLGIYPELFLMDSERIKENSIQSP